MTYGLGLLFKNGVVMIAATRTNVGVDHVCIFKTLHIFQTPGERVMAIAWAGEIYR
jgi:putative proteasome-type protease